jgi:hypothetical protein
MKEFKRGYKNALRDIAELLSYDKRLRHQRALKRRAAKRKRDRILREQREDLSSVYMNLDIRKTPFLNRLNRGIP